MSHEDAIAIIGMSVRLPGADTVADYWRDAFHGTVHIRRFTAAELVAAGIPPEDAADPAFVAATAPLDDVTGFDAAAFEMSPREAAITDPQHRLFLEVCRHALEESGYSGADGRVALYGNTGYHLHPLQGYLRRRLDGRVFDDAFPYNAVNGLQVAFGNHTDFVATRAAFRLGLTGPVMTVQSGCSSGLVAVQAAGHALRAGEADLAVVATAAVHIPQIIGHRHVRGSIHSRSGVCRVFDAESDGMVTGNGAAAVVLKRLDRALADGDTVDAVILATAVNNDGDRKSAYPAPSVPGQVEAVTSALHAAGVSADRIGYVEAHGTGTFKGDPIEFDALTEAFRRHTDRIGYCALGSAKANIGHLDSGAALPSLIRAVGVVKNGLIPPLAGHTAPNPRLALDESPFYLPREVTPWPGPGPRLAGVTALAVGGTNAHLVLSSPPPRPPRRPSRLAPGPLVLSAADPAGLRATAEAWLRRLRRVPTPDPARTAMTAARGRRHHAHRLAITGRTVARWRDGLADYLAGRPGGYVCTDVTTPTTVDDPPATRYVDDGTTDWAAAESGRERLPGYPFRRSRHWIGPPPHETPETHDHDRGGHMPAPGVLTHIQEATAARLGHPVEAVAPSATFLSLGADSLSMVDLARSVEQRFGVRISMRELFEQGDTPAGLAALVADRLPEPTPTTAGHAVPDPQAAPAAPAAQPAPAPAQTPVPPPVPPAAPSSAAAPAHLPPTVPPPEASAPAWHAAPPYPVMPYQVPVADPGYEHRTVAALTGQIQQLITINQSLVNQVAHLTALLHARDGGAR
ncbi:ketoacyl-synthetase-like protein [Stackebrandtia albiflava]|uniref:Ketoacyl-synthetase-like protein n=1 Tax=Stackebrandtia albiflava TaxID=406432 RepID=A0A562VE53_9ACTN|nr:type I polyketide synthase [Stackebrandtia albiflava]TWJ16124.1 ketoacyl-synthetase-like protein [Stackebrandtia albiflava]